jgi:outer membrane protein OmpA-like peptidoglycan-associated protein
MTQKLLTLSALLLIATSPAFAADSASHDSAGNAVRSSSGSCVGDNSSSSKQPGCAKEKPRQTFRILQGMIPQPTVTYTMPPPMAQAETVSIALKQPWESGSAMLTPTQREELYQVMAQLETYRLIDGFEVVTYPGAAKDPSFNRKLAEKRAQTMSSFLASVGIPPGQIVSRIAEPSPAPRSELNVTVRGRR